MQQDLTRIASSELVEMLIKDTEYYMDLCKTVGNDRNKKIVEKHIELITTELKSREDYKEVFQDEDTATRTAE
ncbi:hypothetical protein [Flavitalea sp.]|nr:hypothetical protein [Flavitalea sp.]